MNIFFNFFFTLLLVVDVDSPRALQQVLTCSRAECSPHVHQLQMTATLTAPETAPKAPFRSELTTSIVALREKDSVIKDLQTRLCEREEQQQREIASIRQACTQRVEEKEKSCQADMKLLRKSLQRRDDLKTEQVRAFNVFFPR